jgi:DNA polymerase II small subunit
VEEEPGPDFLVVEDGGRFSPSYSDPREFRNHLLRRLGAARAIAGRRAEPLDSVSDLSPAEGRRRGDRWRVLAILLDRRMSSGRLEVIIEDEEGAARAIVSREAERDVLALLPDEPAIFTLEERGRHIIVRRAEALGTAFRPGIGRRAARSYAAFLSDLHCTGEDCELEGFVHQLTDGLLEGYVARNLGYLVVNGDLADCGCEDPRAVYREAARVLSALPESTVKVIVPGECDAAPSSLPQPPLDRRFRGILEDVPNTYLLGNPSTVLMSGLRVLIYHGQTIHRAMEALGVARPTLAMRKLLSVRSLLPMFGPMDYAIFPGGAEGLEIHSLPNIFHAGHTHMADALKSDNTLLLSTPSWRNPRGPHVPTVAVVDLSTLDVLWRGPLPS